MDGEPKREREREREPGESETGKKGRGCKKETGGSRRGARSTPSVHPGYWLTLPTDWAHGIYAGPRRKPDPALSLSMVTRDSTEL